MTYTCIASSKLQADICSLINRITVDLPTLSPKEVHCFRHSIDGKTFLLTGTNLGAGAFEVAHCDLLPK